MTAYLAVVVFVVACSSEPLELAPDSGPVGDDVGDIDAAVDEQPPANPLPPAEQGVWTWVDIEGSLCRDGSGTGISVRYGSSPNVMIILSGGNACFNQISCAVTPSDTQDHPTGGNVGITDINNSDNPVADWTHVHMQYCSGDVYGGYKADSMHEFLPGVQQFFGFHNVTLALERIVPTFPDADKVLLTGSSAGGFGSAINFDQVARAFKGKAKVILLDDSGPPMSNEFMKSCLQSHWREVWGLDNVMPKDCPNCVGGVGAGIIEYAAYLDAKYPDASLGLLSSLEDAYNSIFFGFGNNDCADLGRYTIPSFPGAEYRAGLLDLRENWFVGPQWASYYVPGTQHTFIDKDDFYTREVNGKKLTTWVAELIDGQNSHVGP